MKWLDFLSFNGCSRPLTDEPGRLTTIPVIPVQDTKSKDVLVLEEGEAVLAVPVVGLVLHPVKPGNLSPVMIPGPVSVLVISVGAVHCGSNPPLVTILVARESRGSRVSIVDQRLEQVVLLRTSALIHINEPSLMEFTDNSSVCLCHSLVQPTQQDALNLATNVADVPTIRAVVSVLGEDSGREEKEEVEHGDGMREVTEDILPDQ